MENQNFQAMTDEEVEQAAGGMMSVMAYIQYASDYVVQPLYGLEARAFGTDKEVVRQITSAIRATMSPTAQIAAPITKLWQSDFPSYYAPRISDPVIKAEAQNLIYAAYRYIIDHQ